MTKLVDVVVVGAGPVGLLTAIELSLGGVRVLVLERLATPSLVTKALGVGPLGSETLQRRGMAAAIDAAEARGFAAMEQVGLNMRERMSKVSGHFAGLFIRKDAHTEPDRRMRMVDQQGLEAMLAERARDLGIEVRRACAGGRTTRGSSTPTAKAACCSPATPRTSTRPSVARA